MTRTRKQVGIDWDGTRFYLVSEMGEGEWIEERRWNSEEQRYERRRLGFDAENCVRRAFHVPGWQTEEVWA